MNTLSLCVILPRPFATSCSGLKARKSTAQGWRTEPLRRGPTALGNRSYNNIFPFPRSAGEGGRRPDGGFARRPIATNCRGQLLNRRELSEQRKWVSGARLKVSGDTPRLSANWHLEIGNWNYRWWGERPREPVLADGHQSCGKTCTKPKRRARSARPPLAFAFFYL